MMPILYGSIVQKATSGKMEELRRLAFLLFTLGNTQYRYNLGPHPATLVRELRLWCSETPSWLEEPLQKALRCTADYAPDGKSQLRTFHWHAGEITISPLLSERPAFENLAELSVTQSCSDISEFEVRPDKALSCVINLPLGSSFSRFRGSSLSHIRSELRLVAWNGRRGAGLPDPWSFSLPYPQDSPSSRWIYRGRTLTSLYWKRQLTRSGYRALKSQASRSSYGTTTWTLISTCSSRHTLPSATCRLFWAIIPCLTMLCPSSEDSPGVPTIFSRFAMVRGPFETSQ
ncbi:hypothetical protein B0H11DRAFT_1261087 [Mycena galericulata]|nr:hypothetical protein B0H11DRAFT_1261087 [Mycena galericulata]